MSQLFNVTNKVAAITGAGGVLCGSIAKQLAQNGLKVALLDLNLKAAEQIANEIIAQDGTAIAIEFNVIEKESLTVAAEKINKTYGNVDILINGAGGNSKKATTSPELPFFDLQEDAIRFVFDLNFIGTVLPSQVFGKEIAQTGSGIIINISSMNAFCPLTKIPAYSAAKAAISNFTQWLAVHMCQNYSTNIRVNAIAPGFFLTEQNRFLLTDENSGQLTPRGKTIVDHTPMNRFGQPEELSGTMLWLISDAAKFVTGIVVPIDGGFSAFSGV